MAHADVAVVGGGIIGCLVAREIASRVPEATIVLIERDAIGSGATRRSAGLHFPRGSTERVRRMTAYSEQYYAALKQTQPWLPIQPVPMYVVASCVREVYETYLDSAAPRPTDEAVVTVPEGARLWRVNGGQHADVPALTKALSRELGPRVSVREGIGVDGLDPADTHVALRLSTGDILTVGHTVLAPGPWLAAPAWKALIQPLGARVKKVVALHVEQVPATSVPVIVFQDEDAFLLPLAQQKRWLFSYTCTEWDVDPDTVATSLSQRDIDEARACLIRYAPELVDRCTAGRVFCDAYSVNREPLVRTLDTAGRVVFAGATNGSGYRLAPAVAAQAADLVLGDR